MMNWIKRVDIYLWGGALLFGVVLPVWSIRLPITHAMWVGLILVILNGIFSVWLGGHLFRRSARWWTLLIFPVIFLLAAYLWLPRYTYYFAFAYLAIVYLSCSLRKQD